MSKRKKEKKGEVFSFNNDQQIEKLLQSPNELKVIMQNGINTQFWQIIKYNLNFNIKEFNKLIREYGSELPELKLKLLIELLNASEKLVSMPENIISMAEINKETKPLELDPYFQTYEEMKQYESRNQ